ncbi:MAG: hypothetical protein O2856_09285 [Planctomycetota bacterium]|nr:hypothetical protein [Planctomycetota bacterium]
MRWNTLIVLSILVANCCSRLTAQELPPLQLAIPQPDSTLQPATSSAEPVRRDLSPDAVRFFRGIALLLIPSEFDDDDGWGDKTNIQSGLKMRFEDGLLRTSRRWRHVNHGNWLRASGKLVDPEERFLLHVAQLPDPEQGTKRYDVDVSARLRVTGQQQQWTHGVMLWSISAEAVTDVELHVILDVKTQVVRTDKGTRLRFLPEATEAEARLADYSLRRISHLKGKSVQEFGDLFESLIHQRVERENKNLANRINKALETKPERLEIPFDIADLFGGADLKKQTNE